MSKIRISTAKRSKKERFNIPTRTCTTLDFGRLCATNVIECTPGDVIKTSYYQETQLASLVTNTFGSAFIKTFAAFVPYRVVFPNFEAFMVKSQDATIDKETPRLSFYTLYRIMFNIDFGVGIVAPDGEEFGSDYAVAEVRQENPSTVVHPKYIKGSDFVFYSEFTTVNNSPVTVIRFNMTAKGRWLVHLFESLGYKLPRMVALSNLGQSVLLSKYRTALPILSYVRFMYDYVYPSQYVQQQGFDYLFQGIGLLDTQAIEDIIKLLFVPYSEDFYTQLWLNPNSVGANSGNEVIAQASNPILNYNSLLSNGNYTYINQTSPNQTQTLSSYGLRLLESISDYVLRNNIGGTRFHEWMKAHFGFVTAPQDSTRSIFLKSFTDEVTFSPIYANTAVQGYQNLGSRAGIGNSRSRGGYNLTFEAKEHGLLLFVTMVVPSTGYVQGEKPWVKELTSPYDLYTPELDSVGLEPVPRSRLFMEYTKWSDNVSIPASRMDEVFGFAPRYADRFKHGQDFLHGDFTFDSRNENMQSYHTFRDVTYNRPNLALDAQFLQADNQFDRIFAVDPNDDLIGDSYDKFISFFVFDAVRYSNMLSIGESMPLFNKQGDDVLLDNTGTSVIG